MCALFFEPQGEGVHRCKICGADRKQLPGTGYSNLLSPLSSRHEDFRAQYNAQNRDTDRLLQDFGFVSEAIYQRYQWLWWVVVRGMPLSEVDDELTRAMSKWQPTNSKAVKADMITVATKLGAVITEEMGIVFGVMCDGWTHGIMHFVAIYGQYVVGGQLRRTLLVMSPPDERSRDGDAHIALLRNVLAVYNKTIDVILFLVADNCSTNHSIANKLGIPLVGCASHRFNLAVKKFLTEHEDLLHQVNNLMLQLHQQKNGAELFMLTPLRPKKRNVTRWSSTYNPVQGYGAIRPQSRLVEAVEDLVPSTGDHKKLVGLLKHLEKLDSVCKRLQCETTTMSEVRLLFDSVVADYPIMGGHLKSTAKILHSPAFENGLVKICDGDKLSAAETAALRRFEASARNAKIATLLRLSSRAGPSGVRWSERCTARWRHQCRQP
ncbi:hypothetical protein PC116_g22924 [Phytophthora cactorum]|nr:hypothetical protein Pcac1_g11645 [Phytophthora cactorum]KAG4228727.1 hypothetical protein PC116_g22924 [Phytophthora cactorum]